MCKLEGINFGFADSERELEETPELFDSAFIDPRNYLSKLLDGPHFLVLGRKGTGKTAYGAKIRRLSMENTDIVVKSCFLSDLNYSKFEEFADQNLKGGRRFLYIWKFLLFLEIIKLITDRFPNNENVEFNTLVDALAKYGVLPTEDIVHTAKHLNVSNLSLRVPNFVSAGKTLKEELVLNGTDEIAELGIEILRST